MADFTIGMDRFAPTPEAAPAADAQQEQDFSFIDNWMEQPATPGNQPQAPVAQSQAEDLNFIDDWFDRPTEESRPERAAAIQQQMPTAPRGQGGFLGGVQEFGRGLVRGAVKEPSRWVQAAENVGKETGLYEMKGEGEEARLAAEQTLKESVPWAQQSAEALAAGQESTTSGLEGAGGAGESMVASMGLPAAGAAIGATIGSIIPVAGTAVGAGVGLAAGTLAQLASFYFSTAQETYDYTKPKAVQKHVQAGKTPEEAERLAEEEATLAGRKAGAWEVGTEFLTDLVTFRAAKFLPKSVKEGIVKSIAGGKFSLKDLTKAVVGVAAVETAGEMATAAGQEEATTTATGETPRYREAVERSIVPSAIMGLAFGTMGGTYNAIDRRRMYQALTSPDSTAAEKAEASRKVYQLVKEQDADLAERWAQEATNAIREGRPITIQDDAAYAAVDNLVEEGYHEGEGGLGLGALVEKMAMAFEAAKLEDVAAGEAPAPQAPQPPAPEAFTAPKTAPTPAPVAPGAAPPVEPFAPGDVEALAAQRRQAAQAAVQDKVDGRTPPTGVEIGEPPLPEGTIPYTPTPVPTVEAAPPKEPKPWERTQILAMGDLQLEPLEVPGPTATEKAFTAMEAEEAAKKSGDFIKAFLTDQNQMQAAYRRALAAQEGAQPVQIPTGPSLITITPEAQPGRFSLRSGAKDAPGTVSIPAAGTKIRTTLRQVGTFSGAPVIRYPADVAHATRDLMLEPTEVSMFVVTDKANKPIHIIKHSMGKVSSGPIQMGHLLGSIKATPGAANVWAVHNHPGGNPMQSDADRTAGIVMDVLSRMSGISYKGSVVISPEGTASYVPPISEKGGLPASATPKGAPKQPVEGPVVQRSYTPEGLAKPVSKVTGKVGSIFNQVAREGEVLRRFGETPAVIITDARGDILGSVAMTEQEMSALQGRGAQVGDRIMRAMHETNGDRFVIMTPQEVSTQSVENTAKFLYLVGALRVEHANFGDTTIGEVTKESLEGKGGFLSMRGERRGRPGLQMEGESQQKAAPKAEAPKAEAPKPEAQQAEVVDLAKFNKRLATTLQAMVNLIRAQTRGAPEVTVVDKVSDLPAEVRTRNGVPDNAEGFYDVGHDHVYLVASNLDTPKRAAQVFIHETVVHAGLRRVFGNRLDAVLDDILAAHKAGKLNWFKGKQGERLNLDNIADRYDMDLNNPAQARIVAEEFLAHLSEYGIERGGFLPRARMAVSSFLRHIPGSPWKFPSKTEVQAILRAAQGAIEYNQPGYVPGRFGVPVPGAPGVQAGAGSMAMFSLNTWTDASQKAAWKQAQKVGIQKEKFDKWVEDIDTIARIVAADPNLQFEASPLYEALKPNADKHYKFSLDFSTICIKRLKMGKTMEQIQLKLNRALSPEEFLAVREMMDNKGYEVSCGICYVESRRMFRGNRINKLREEKGYSSIPLDYFITQEGIDRLLVEYPLVYKDVFGKASNIAGKAREARTEYKGNLLTHYRGAKGQKMVEEINRYSGQRWQSWSDFELIHALDAMQATLDSAAIGLAGHAYTKVPAFVEFMGKTGLMINMSLIARGMGVKNGKLVFDEKEGMSYSEALRLRDLFPNTAGTILVGVSDEHILAAMADPNIDYIIPYHHSGLAEDKRNRMGMKGWQDYTETQLEVVTDKKRQRELGAKFGFSKKTQKETIKLVTPDVEEWWDPNISPDENGERYVQLARSMGLREKFPQFAGKPGYWKLLIDRKMVNHQTGEYIKQRPLEPNFDTEWLGKKLKEYTPVDDVPAADVIEEFLADPKANSEKFTKTYSTMITSATRKIEKALAKGDEVEARTLVSTYPYPEIEEAYPQLVTKAPKYAELPVTIGSQGPVNDLGQQGNARFSMKRSPKLGVGKDIGGRIYVHRSAMDALPADIQERANAAKVPFDWHVVKYDPRYNDFSLIESPDFDTADEPTVGWAYNPWSNRSYPPPADPWIYHHKWTMVKPDYKGFDVAASERRSRRWENVPGIDKARIGKKSYWERVAVPQINTWGMEHPEAAEHNVRLSQKETSADTSIKQVAAALKKIAWVPGSRNFDLGGGKYDLGVQHLASHGVESRVFDPFNRTPEHNAEVMAWAKQNPPDTVTVMNVLNVIDDDAAMENVIRQAAEIVKPDGDVYFQVYKADKPGKTAKGYQRAQDTREYIPYIRRHFQDVEVTKGYIVARMPLKPEAVDLGKTWFESSVVRGIQNLPQSKGSGQQMVAMLKKMGAKQGELDWMGFEEEFGWRPSVTRDELLDYAVKHQVNLHEVVYGERDEFPKGATRSNMEDIENIRGTWVKDDPSDNTYYMDTNAGRYNVEVSGPWSNRLYTYYLDGEQLGQTYDWGQFVDAVIDDYSSREGLPVPKFAGATKFQAYSFLGHKGYREFLMRYIDSRIQDGWDVYNADGKFVMATRDDLVRRQYKDAGFKVVPHMPKQEGFTGAHWGPVNVIAHSRVEDLEMDGKRTLLINEIQSDWLQDQKKGKDVPRGPLQKVWPMTVFKRMMNLAASEGYSRIAWVGGEEQASRYDLRQTVSEIGWADLKDGTFDVTVEFVSGDDPWVYRGQTPEQIEKLLGKGIAAKITDKDNDVAGIIDGEDLKVGGEGMLNFYDDILPKEVNKYVKKWGTRAQPVSLPREDRFGGPVAGWALDITPEMREASLKPQTLFSLRQHDAATEEALRKAGVGVDRRGVIQKGKDAYAAAKVRREGWRDRIAQGGFDRFHAIKAAARDQVPGIAVEQDPYISARMSTGSTSTIWASLFYGTPQWEGNVVTRKPNSKGLMEILKPVAEHNREFFGWMVGRRGERLKREGREQLLTDTDLAALNALHRPEFDKVAEELAAFNKDILDFAEEAGLINPEDRALWENVDYIPFYRVFDKGQVKAGGMVRRGLSHMDAAIKRLQGSNLDINDPLQNILHNTAHLIEASMKNNALLNAAEVLSGHENGVWERIPSVKYKQELVPLEQIRKMLKEMGLDVEWLIPNDALRGLGKMWAFARPEGDDVIRVMNEGKPVYFRIHDPLLLRALTGVNQENMVGLAGFRFFKRLLTKGVTMDPTFMVRNFIRDAAQAWVVSEQGITPVLSSLRGAISSVGKDETAIEMMFSGASFMGGYVSSGSVEESARHLRSALKRAEKGTVLRTPMDLLRAYSDIGDGIENASRAAIYKATREKTGSKLQAAYEARDMMDYSMQGDWGIIRFFGDILPFFNARVQGLYKLGRAGTDRKTRAGFYAKGLMITLASLALAANNDGEDWYEELEDHQKDAYWWFKVPGKEAPFKIPKPFELGAIFGTGAERMYRSLSGSDTPERTFARFGAMLRDTFALNPVPQAFLPGVETWANKDFFRGRSIENLSDEKKLAWARYNEHTSPTMRLLAKGLSILPNEMQIGPKKLEHLWNGYLGTIGTYVLAGADIVTRAATDMPPVPGIREAELADWPVLAAFMGREIPRSSLYTSELYDMARQAQMVRQTVNQLNKAGDPVGAAEVMERYRARFLTEPVLQRASDYLNNIRKQQDAIMRNPLYPPHKKKELLDLIQQQKLKQAQEFWKLARQTWD